MTRRIFLFTLFLASFALLGAGCIRFKADVNDSGVFLSEDSGATWVHRVFVRQEKKKVITIAGELATRLVADAKNPDTLYLGTEGGGVYKTTNRGEAWDLFLSARGRVHALGVNMKDPKLIFVAMGDRIFRTTNGGEEWAVVYAEPNPKVTMIDLALDGFDPKKVYVSLSNGDLMRSTDGGVTWAKLYHTNTPILHILVHPKDTRVITLMTQFDGLFRSTNLGKDWTSLRSILEPFPDALRGQALVSDPNNASHLLYASYYGMLSSTDAGKTWKPIPLLTASNVTPTTALALAPSKPNILYYTTPTTLFVSLDGGKAWATQLLPTGKRPAAIFVHPKESKIIYLATTKLR